MRIAWTAFFLTVLAATPTLATNFYATKNMASESCHVVLAEPDGEVMKKLGGPYASYDEAMDAIKDTPECGKPGDYK